MYIEDAICESAAAVYEDEFVYIVADWLIDDDVTTWRRPCELLPVLLFYMSTSSLSNLHERAIHDHIYPEAVISVECGITSS